MGETGPSLYFDAAEQDALGRSSQPDSCFALCGRGTRWLCGAQPIHWRRVPSWLQPRHRWDHSQFVWEIVRTREEAADHSRGPLGTKVPAYLSSTIPTNSHSFAVRHLSSRNRRCGPRRPTGVGRWNGAIISAFLTFLKFFRLRDRKMWVNHLASQDKAVRLRCPSGYWVFPAGMIGRAASFFTGLGQWRVDPIHRPGRAFSREMGIGPRPQIC